MGGSLGPVISSDRLKWRPLSGGSTAAADGLVTQRSLDRSVVASSSTNPYGALRTCTERPMQLRLLHDHDSVGARDDDETHRGHFSDSKLPSSALWGCPSLRGRKRVQSRPEAGGGACPLCIVPFLNNPLPFWTPESSCHLAGDLRSPEVSRSGAADNRGQ